MPTRRGRLASRRRESGHKPPCSSGLRRLLSFLDVRRLGGPFWGPLFSTGRITRSLDCPGAWPRRGERRKRRCLRRSEGNGKRKRPSRWKRREKRPRARKVICVPNRRRLTEARLRRHCTSITGKKGCCGSAHTRWISTGRTRFRIRRREKKNL